MTKCNNCGTELNDGVRFCGNCGAKIDEGTASALGTQPQTSVSAASPTPYYAQPQTKASDLYAQTSAKSKRFSPKKIIAIAVAVVVVVAVAVFVRSNIADNDKLVSSNNTTQSTKKTNSKTPITINPSPDKYTWYIRDYVGRNCATIGEYSEFYKCAYDDYGAGGLIVKFVSTDGSYLEINSFEDLKKYIVTSQNLPPNTELKLVFEKDSSGKEYNTIVESQSYDEIILTVKKIQS